MLLFSYFIRPPANDKKQEQPADNKQQRKQRAVNERAIYRPPPARSSGVLQETAKQNVDPGNLTTFFIFFTFLKIQQRKLNSFSTCASSKS